MSSTPAPSKWYCRRGDQIRGPFTSQELRELAAAAKIKPTDQVRQGVKGTWVDASSIRGLFEPAQTAAPPRPNATWQRSTLPPTDVASQQATVVVCASCGRRVQLPVGSIEQTLACPFCGNHLPNAPMAQPPSSAMPVQPMASAMPSTVGEVECPFCSELIKATAKKCKHCGEILDVALRTAMAGHSQVVTVNVGSHNIGLPAEAPQQERNQLLAVLLAFLFGPFGLLYSSVIGALLMLVLAILLAMVEPLLGVFIWIACIIWAAVATSPNRCEP